MREDQQSKKPQQVPDTRTWVGPDTPPKPPEKPAKVTPPPQK